MIFILYLAFSYISVRSSSTVERTGRSLTVRLDWNLVAVSTLNARNKQMQNSIKYKSLAGAAREGEAGPLSVLTANLLDNNGVFILHKAVWVSGTCD